MTDRVIDVTPTWEQILPALLLIIEQAETETARAKARAELQRMARLADRAVALLKAAQEVAA